MHASSVVVLRRLGLGPIFGSEFKRRSAVLCAVLIGFSGCASAPPPSAMPTKVAPDVQTLTPGDVIMVSFPGAQNLDTKQQVRRDGRINLYMIGEVKAADKTPAELEKELIQAYSSQLTSKEIKVTVVSSSFAVFVTGAVLKPGKIAPDRALTAFDAIMEAGGFDTAKANTKQVRVFRQEDGQLKMYIIDMKAVLEGRQTEPFYLKSGDAVFVPEKIPWF
jgi:polysaccharide export outer membrane protein